MSDLLVSLLERIVNTVTRIELKVDEVRLHKLPTSTAIEQYAEIFCNVFSLPASALRGKMQYDSIRSQRKAFITGAFDLGFEIADIARFMGRKVRTVYWLKEHSQAIAESDLYKLAIVISTYKGVRGEG